MFSYIFVLGKATDLCRQELETVLASKNFIFKTIYDSEQIYHLETEKQIDKAFLQDLGGAIKMARVIGKLGKFDDLTFLISDYLKKTSDKITFGLSLYGQNKLGVRKILLWAQEIKRSLKKAASSCRFVLPTEDYALSSVQITKQRVQEFIISFENDKIIIAVTENVFDFADWNKRDYSRPEFDPKSGMLPPKVARMMVNIGRWMMDDRKLKEKTLLDPFCGMGTILQEGLSMGFKVIGSDQDDQAVLKAQNNLVWFCGEYKVLSSKYRVLNSKAEHISQQLPAGFLADVIITEPYLGPNIIPIYGIVNIIDGLSRLYIGCFSDWKNILKDTGLIVIAFPSFFINNKEYFVREAIDKIQKLGYSIETGPLPYYRPQAVVRRNIYMFRKSKS